MPLCISPQKVYQLFNRRMRRGKVAELEERLNEIRNRRGLLESAFAEKQALLNQLDSARGDSMKRLVASIEEQNQKARERNYKFLEDILVASHQPSSSFSSFSTENNNSECKKRLLDAKKNFVRMMENALPSLHRSESIRLEEKMRSLQMEKMQSLQRREKLRHELANEEKVKMELEHQRRELVQSLALEQRDLMEAEASSAYLLAEGKLVDEHIKENVNTYGQQLEYILQDRLRNYSARDAVPRLASNPVPIPHSHVRPRVVDSHPAESLLATSQQVQFYSEEEEEEEEELLPESQPNQAPSKPESQFKTEVSSFHDDKSLPEAKSSSRQSTEFKLNTSVIQGKDQDTVQSFADSKDDFSEDSIHESKLTTTNNNDKEVPMGTNTSISIPLNRYDEVSEFDISLDHGATVQQPQNSIKVTNKEENATVATTSQKIESKTSATTGSTSSSATKLAPVEKSFVEPIDNNLPSLEELELGRCQSICNQIFSSILNKVTFDGQVKEIYQEQRSEADLRAVRYHIKSILDNDNRQVSPRNDKLQGDIVLAILSAKGDLLMPK